MRLVSTYKTPMLIAIMTPSFSFKVMFADQMIHQGMRARVMSITPEYMAAKIL